MILLKIKDRYFGWGPNVKAPTTFDMMQEELLAYVKKKYPKICVAELLCLLTDLDIHGSNIDYPVDEIIKDNCAGVDGKHMTTDEIYFMYTRSMYRYNPLSKAKGIRPPPEGSVGRVNSSKAVWSGHVNFRTLNGKDYYNLPFDDFCHV